MKEIEYRTIDKADWPRGEWDNEPDKVQFRDAATGLPCLAVRHRDLGHWCGYVGVAAGHPAFEKGYNDVNVETHGGLTFADSCQPSETESHGICHLPEAGEPDHVWWLGFDCAHAWDLSPGRDPRWQSFDQTYKSLAYVKSECVELAAQLAAMS